MLNESFLTTSDREEWERYLPHTRSVFGSHGYATLNERFRGISARLHVLQEEGGAVCHPMLLRPLSDLPFEGMFGARWDITTPEFTGPLETGNATALRPRLPSARETCMAREGIVAEFAHLHPWGNGAALLGEGVTANREIVWVDVTQPPEQLFSDSFAHACRKNILKAEREGVETFISDADEDIAKFFEIYSGTMERNNAQPRYAFSVEYFLAIRDLLPGGARFVFARHGEHTVAATLYLFDDTDVYSFLGGADAAFQHVRPTNLVIWDTIQWSHQSGRKRLVLGGGYRPDDGIFRFKATFSPLRRTFSTYRQVHQPEHYAILAARARAHYGRPTDHGSSYFPTYRDDSAG